MRDITRERLTMLSTRTRMWAEQGPTKIPVEERRELAMMMAGTLTDFVEFAVLGMKFLGFPMTAMQANIAEFMASGPEKAMIAAQRGEAKTTLAALYAVWCIIRDQSTRVMIVSAASKQSSDVAVLIIRLIEQWHLLCYLRPDIMRGDRTSYDAYDVHCDLKGIDKSASVSCRGITSQLQGSRADLLIADDIESSENGLSQTNRDTLLNKTKEFSAIVTHGKILYLGTPQSKHSIYKTLPARGFVVRVWPGRFPTKEQAEHYGDTLAPWITQQMQEDPSLCEPRWGVSGDLGAPADPQRYDENSLCDKELDYGPEGFGLQFLLDTTLSDEARTKIKLSDIPFMHGAIEVAPEHVWYSADPKHQLPMDVHGPFGTAKLFAPMAVAEKLIPFQMKCMRVDPAGNGGDEVAFAIGGAVNSYIHLLCVGGFKGGCSEENLQKLLALAVEHGVTQICIERNMGHGTVTQLMQAEAIKGKIKGIAIIDEWSSGQKERRIIDTISPLTRRHKFIVHQSAVLYDAECLKVYPADKRNLYSAFYQMQNITYDRGCLAKDDRADAIEGVVRDLSKFLVADEEDAARKRDEQAAREYMANPMGYSSRVLNAGAASSNRMSRGNTFRSRHRG